MTSVLFPNTPEYLKALDYQVRNLIAYLCQEVDELRKTYTGEQVNSKEYERNLQEAKDEYNEWLRDRKTRKTYWTKTVKEIDPMEFIKMYSPKPTNGAE